MHGPKPQHPITLNPDVLARFQQLVRAHRTPQTHVLRARILLAAHEHPEWSNQ